MKPRALPIAALIVGLAAIVDPGAQAPAAAVPVGVRVPFGPVLMGEVTRVTGEVGTAGRPVELHVLTPDGWQLSDSKVAGSAGRFSFPVRVTRAATRYEVRVPKAKVGGATHRREPPTVVTVQAIVPTAELSIFPAPVGQARSGRSGLTPAAATFTPRQPGAKVTIQRLVGKYWVAVARGTQDGTGRFTQQVAAGTVQAPHTFRVGTVPAKGLEAVYSEPVTAQVWPQVWADEFNGSELDPAWSERPSGGPTRDCSSTSPANVTVGQGVAELSVTEDKDRPADPEGCPYGHFHNGHIGTQASKTFTYGAFAARVRFSPERGQHGAFWLQPGAAEPGAAEPGAAEPGAAETAASLEPEHAGSEIDVAEYFGDSEEEDGFQTWIHWTSHLTEGVRNRVATGTELPGAYGMLGAGKTPSNSFHVVSLEWTPEEYVFRLDGVETYRTGDGVSHRPEFLILSMLSSNWELPDRPDGPTSPMSVDWVRVWQPDVPAPDDAAVSG